MNKKKRIGAFLLVILGIIIFCILSYFIYSKMLKSFTLNGGKVVTVTVKTIFNDPGYKINKNEKNKKVIVTNNIDIEKLGTYEVVYKHKNKTYKRTIKVVDDIAPSILLAGKEKITVCAGKEYIEEGYNVTDNYDLDLTEKVTITKEKDKIIYTVKDSSGNVSSKVRELGGIDVTLPKINLSGGTNVTIYEGTNYVDKFSASDNCDGDITSKVIKTGTVDKKIGTYKINYEVTDSSGNTSKITRTVYVTKKPSYAESTIYLTFDDGPDKNITPKILDTLKKYNIKGTFFVNYKNIDTDYIIKRAHDEGHVIANHTASHNYSYIYSSETAFFKDLEKMENKIISLTGTSHKIMRFPGGVSNTVSRNYNKGIMSRLHKEIQNKGYIYFDWNVSSGDTGTKDPVRICNTIKNQLGKGTNIVLMHDSLGRTGSMNALPCIIEYGIEMGYKFDVISRVTPTIRHGIAN